MCSAYIDEGRVRKLAVGVAADVHEGEREAGVIVHEIAFLPAVPELHILHLGTTCRRTQHHVISHNAKLTYLSGHRGFNDC